VHGGEVALEVEGALDGLGGAFGNVAFVD
jgi:hypothetical protein